MAREDAPCPLSITTTIKRWTSGEINTPQVFFAIFAQIYLVSLEKCGEKMSFFRLSHDGAISPLGSNGLLKSKETIISLDYVIFYNYILLYYILQECSQGTYTPVSPYKEANGQSKGSGAGEVTKFIYRRDAHFEGRSQRRKRDSMRHPHPPSL